MCQGMQKPTEVKSINEKESAWTQQITDMYNLL